MGVAWEMVSMRGALTGTSSILWGTGRNRGWGWPIIGGLATATVAVIEENLVGIGPTLWSAAFWGAIDGAVVALAIVHIGKRVTTIS